MIEGFGLALVDILLNVPGKIILNQKHVVSAEMLQIGGVIPTALIFLSRLGLNCSFHSSATQDSLGKLIDNFLVSEKVNFEPIWKTGATPTAAVVVEQSTGKRTGFYHLGAFADLTIKDVETIKFAENSKFLLIDAHNFDCSQALVKKARSQGLIVLLDLGSYKKSAEKLIPLVDVVFVPEVFRQTIAPGQDPAQVAQKLQRQGPKICVVTMGEQGSYIASEGQVFHQPAFKVKAIDTNDAGDVFMGGFAYGLAKNWPLPKTAQFAAAAAAITCTKFGKIQAMPKSEREIFSFMKSSDTYKEGKSLISLVNPLITASRPRVASP